MSRQASDTRSQYPGGGTMTPAAPRTGSKTRAETFGFSAMCRVTRVAQRTSQEGYSSSNGQR